MRARLLLLLIVGGFTFGCAKEPAPPRAPRPLTVDQARAKMVEAVRDQGGGTLFLMPVEETTPAGVFDEMGVQTFRVLDEPDEPFAFETFAVTDEEVVQVGSGLGGPGITSMTMTDVDGDGRPDLLYVAGSGRRIKSFNAGAVDRPGFEKFDPTRPVVEGEVQQPRPLRRRDVALDYRDPIELRQSPSGLEVWDSGRNVKLGVLEMRDDGANFVAADDLPTAVKRRFKSPRM